MSSFSAMKQHHLTLLLGTLVLLGNNLQATADIIGASKPPTRELSNRLDEARRLLRSGDLAETQTFLKKYFETAQNQPHPDILLARLLNELNRPADAGRVLEALAAAHPNRLDLRLVFGELAIRQSRWFEAWIHLVAAEQAEPPANWTEEHAAAVRRDVLASKAQCCEGREDWATAGDLYSELIATGTTDDKTKYASLLAALGRCRFHQDRIKEATRHFAAAWRADPSRDVCELALATLCHAAERKQDAEEFFRLAVRHDDDSGRARAELSFAQWLLWNNQPDEIPRVLRTEQHDPGMVRERELLLAMSDRMQQQYVAAQERLAALHQANPASFPISNQLALVMIESSDEGLRSRALQIAEANARNHSQLSESWATLGWIQFRLGDLASARQNLSRGMSGRVISRDTAWHLAQIHQHLGNPAEARELSSAALTSQGPFFSAASAAATGPGPSETADDL